MELRHGKSERGVMVLIYLFAFAMVVVVAGLRYWNMGDLPASQKMTQAMLWGALAAVVGIVFVKSVGVLVSDADFTEGNPFSSNSAADVSPVDIGSVKPEELDKFESEMPEMEQPDVEGLKGRPPEELASALSSMADTE